jgi:hypothetical protein
MMTKTKPKHKPAHQKPSAHQVKGGVAAMSRAMYARVASAGVKTNRKYKKD